GVHGQHSRPTRIAGRRVPGGERGRGYGVGCEQGSGEAAILGGWRAERPGLDVSPVAIFGRIERIERHQAAAVREIWRRHRIDPGEYSVLAALRRSGPDYRLTPTELYRSVLVTSATM